MTKLGNKVNSSRNQMKSILDKHDGECKNALIQNMFELMDHTSGRKKLLTL